MKTPWNADDDGVDEQVDDENNTMRQTHFVVHPNQTPNQVANLIDQKACPMQKMVVEGRMRGHCIRLHE
mgnify:CR=1 FL=1